MKKYLTQFALSVVITLGLAAPVLLTTQSVALADAKSSVCEGIGAIDGTASGCDDSKAATESKVNTTVQNIVNIFSWAAGITAVFMVMLGGFWYMTSNGDAAKATRGRTTIMYALIGLVIIALAQVIVRFVIGVLL